MCITWSGSTESEAFPPRDPILAIPKLSRSLSRSSSLGQENTVDLTNQARVQLPLTLSDMSEPEPDFALVPLASRFDGPRHYDHVDLVFEAAHTSLPFDRGEKASLYAKAGVPDYWILNLKKGRLEVRRDLVEDDQAPYARHYSWPGASAPGRGPWSGHS
jgi:hypothetical protein